ncbi:hypothetical protein RHMOL_Rhmol11G0227300 [Rhododendron molle]|uniref:Uncharacterized protein n=1 Tax=Rhododendron molle TaxID=49168 RepID=A0ACC0LVG2_RHOML|nr:hypothetical protein RHMOL_Rhmol11G0227300 [Rhododendron molle]
MNSEKRQQDMANAVGIVRSLRDIPPAHYCIKINSFSFMVNNKIEDYESGVFEVGGYKWKLSLYPNGNKKRNVTDHISLYLRIADTEALPPGWEVNVSFKLFVYDHIKDKYLTIQDGEIQRFHWMKTQLGFDKFLPLDTFNDVTNGYLLDDCCVFGTEVFVLKNSGKGECMSLIEDPVNNSYTWKIEKFSAVKDEYLYSPDFVVGDHKWKLLLYPKGSKHSKGKVVSLFLELAGCQNLPNERIVYAEFKLRMKNQADGTWSEHGGAKLKHWFGTSSPNWGFPDFKALTDLNNASKGFLVNDAVVVEAQITEIFALAHAHPSLGLTKFHPQAVRSGKKAPWAILFQLANVRKCHQLASILIRLEA